MAVAGGIDDDMDSGDGDDGLWTNIKSNVVFVFIKWVKNNVVKDDDDEVN